MMAEGISTEFMLPVFIPTAKAADWKPVMSKVLPEGAFHWTTLLAGQLHVPVAGCTEVIAQLEVIMLSADEPGGLVIEIDILDTPSVCDVGFEITVPQTALSELWVPKGPGAISEIPTLFRYFSDRTSVVVELPDLAESSSLTV